jgi:hypothetical protein
MSKRIQGQHREEQIVRFSHSSRWLVVNGTFLEFLEILPAIAVLALRGPQTLS